MSNALVADVAGAPRELIDPVTGQVAGRVRQSLFGQRVWSGDVSSPLLFAGQYADEESGWVYNRCRFYDPAAGVYGSQDPLGVSPNLATAQGYVDHPGYLTDPYGLKAHSIGGWDKNHVLGKDVYQSNSGNVFDPYKELNKRGGGVETNVDRMGRGEAPIGVDGKSVNLHHIGQRDNSSLVELTQTRHTSSSHQLHIFDGMKRSEFPIDVTPVNRESFNSWRSEYWMERASSF